MCNGPAHTEVVAVRVPQEEFTHSPRLVAGSTDHFSADLLTFLVGRVYVGHWVATLDYETKKKQAEWFFAAPVDDARRELLARAGVTYVVVGPHERLLGASEPTDPLLTPVFHTDGATVYRVQR